jgi:60 kDa SS-A/Ro ribonucleoprotein
MKYADIISAEVPQTEALNERQVKNNAGGFVFAIDDWVRFDRFLILGSDAPTYYQKTPQLTRESAEVVDAALPPMPPALSPARSRSPTRAGRRRTIQPSSCWRSVPRIPTRRCASWRWRPCQKSAAPRRTCSGS